MNANWRRLDIVESDGGNAATRCHTRRRPADFYRAPLDQPEAVAKVTADPHLQQHQVYKTAPLL